MKKISLFLLIALLVCSLFTGCRRMNDTTGVGTTEKPTPTPSTTLLPMPSMTDGSTAPDSTAGSTGTPGTTAPSTTAPGSTGMARAHRGPRY